MNRPRIGIVYDSSFEEMFPNAPRERIEQDSILPVVERVEGILSDAGYPVERLPIGLDRRRFLARFAKGDAEAIFNLCEGLGEDALGEVAVASVFELLRLPYTGSPPSCLATALCKGLSKELLRAHGLPTPRHALLEGETNGRVGLKFPLLVKPSHEDASAGIDRGSVVYRRAALRRRVEQLCAQFHQPALVEEYLKGREFNVTIFGNDPAEVLPLSEIDFSDLPSDCPPIVTFRAKWDPGSDEYRGTRPVCPAKVGVRLRRKLETLARRAGQLLGCRDYCRVDLRLAADGTPFVLEVNPNPDLSEDAGVARAASAHGWSYDELILRTMELALERVNKPVAVPVPL